MVKRTYYLGSSGPRDKTKYVKRKEIILKYRSVIDEPQVINGTDGGRWGDKPVPEQILVVMKMAKEYEDFITNGEMVSILRPKLNLEDPAIWERDAVNSAVCRLRNKIDKYFVMVCFSEHRVIPEYEMYGLQWTYEAITDYRTFMRVYGNKMKNIIENTDRRFATYREYFRYSSKEADRRLDSLLRFLRSGGEIGEWVDDRDNRRRRG